MTLQIGQPWTDDNDKELRRLSAAGESPASIARLLGRSTRAIKLRLARGRRLRKPQPITLTDEDRALLWTAHFDGGGWVLPALSDEAALRLEMAHLVEQRRGQWYLLPKAFRARIAIRRDTKGMPPLADPTAAGLMTA